MYSFQIESELNASSKEVAEHCLTMNGVNYELLPIAKMTVAREWKLKPLNDWPANDYICYSLILLFGFLPVDVHRIKFLSTSETGFCEASTSLIHKLWNHKREIVAVGDKTKIIDKINYVPRINVIGNLLKPIYKFIFDRRHKRLLAKFGK